MRRLELDRLEVEETTSYAGVLLVLRVGREEVSLDVNDASALAGALAEWLQERARG